jgi:hypothetical protein
MENFTVHYIKTRRATMPKCGVCGWSFSDRTLMKHAETPCGEESEKAGKYLPEIDDLQRQEEEFFSE